MNCTSCNRDIADYSVYCSHCGTRQRTVSPRRQLMLSSTDSKIAGVCGGIAEYFDVDATIVRLIWTALSIVPGGFVGGILAYVFAWLIIPRAPAPVASLPPAHIDDPAKTS